MVRLLAVPLLLALALPAQARLPGPLQVKAEVTADASLLPSAGTASLHVKLTCSEPMERAYAVRIELRTGHTVLLQRDHAPPVPSRKWVPGTPVEYDLPLAFRT